MSKTLRALPWILLAVTVIAAVAGYFLLPDTLTVQITADGSAGNRLPKLPALLIPVALAVLGAVWSRDQGNGKALAVSVVALVMLALTFVFNL